MAGKARQKAQVYHSAKSLRHRLVLSTLSQTPLHIKAIRPNSQTPGLSPSEISFIRLLDKLTTGTTIQINDTGTTLFYNGGLLLGGTISHTCHPSRAISYYLSPLLMLAPFCKHALHITLSGPTHSSSDPSIDTLATVSIPLLRRLTLGTPLSPTLDIKRRAILSPASANGGGTGGNVVFSCGLATRKLRPVDLVDAGFVTKIRGLAFVNRTSPALVGRMVDATRRALNGYLADVYVHTDHGNVNGCGVGFGLSLVAESSEGSLVGADWSVGKAGVEPETVARKCAKMLLEEVAGGGCVDVGCVEIGLLFCAVADCDVSRVRIGRLGEGSVRFMRDLERFFGVVFSVKVEEGEDRDVEGGVVLSCVGIGLTNVARQRF